MVEVVYERPSNLGEISELKKKGGMLFSGGTDVFVKIRKGSVKPKMLIDTKWVKTPGVEYDGNYLKIYMNATYTDVLQSGYLKDFPILESILKSVGSKQIRNRGTPVGNIGNASPAGDFLLASYLYDAKVVIAPDMRETYVKEIVSGPGKLNLKDGEFIYSVVFEKKDRYVGYFEKVGRRNALVIAIASIGILLKTDGNVIDDVKIAYGSLGPTVVRFEDLESEMKGRVFSAETFDEFSKRYMERIKPITDIRASKEYRKILSRNLLLKAFQVFSRAI